MGRPLKDVSWADLCDMYRRSTYALGKKGVSLQVLARERGGVCSATLMNHFLRNLQALQQDAQDNPISPEAFQIEQDRRKAHRDLQRAAKLIAESYRLLSKSTRITLPEVIDKVRRGVNENLDRASVKQSDRAPAPESPPLSAWDEKIAQQPLSTPRQMAAPYLPDVRTLTGLDAYALALDTVTDDKIKENDPPRLSEGASMADLLAFGDNPDTSNPLSGASRAELEGQWGNLQLELLLGEARDAENVLVECAIQRWRTDTPPQDYQIERYERQLDALRDVWARIQALKAEQASSQAEQTRPQPDPAPLTGVPGPKTSLHSLSTIGHCRIETEETA